MQEPDADDQGAGVRHESGTSAAVDYHFDYQPHTLSRSASACSARVPALGLVVDRHGGDSG